MFPLFQTLQMACMSSSLRPTWRQRAKRPKRPQTPTSRCWKGWPRPSTRGTRASPLWSTCHSLARAKAPTTPSCTVWAAMCRTSHLCGNCHGNCTCGHSTWAYMGTGKIITFAFHFFHFKTFFGFFTFQKRKWKRKSYFFTFQKRKWKWKKWKNHFSTFPEKVLKWKKWKAKVKSESDYFSPSNVWTWVMGHETQFIKLIGI